jgi:hypothetical protein
MSARDEKVRKVEAAIEAILSHWYDSIKEHYVTEEESQELGVEPEIKCFLKPGNYRLKLSRQNELDVTYGLAAQEKDGQLFVVSSVNNKSKGFDYDSFVERLKSHYWRSRNEKPWTDPIVDHFAYGDLLLFEPRMGKSVALEFRKDKADIVRLYFAVEPQYEKLLMENETLLQDLLENYCLNPLKRIYAESYREL